MFLEEVDRRRAPGLGPIAPIAGQLLAPKAGIHACCGWDSRLRLGAHEESVDGRTYLAAAHQVRGRLPRHVACARFERACCHEAVHGCTPREQAMGKIAATRQTSWDWACASCLNRRLRSPHALYLPG